MLTDKQYQQAADDLGVTVPHIKAFEFVESNGDGFLADGRPKILFERHVFYRQLKAAKGQVYADRIARDFPYICNTKPGGYSGGAAEHNRLAQAVAIDRPSALESCSWGGFQIMGFHWKALGYSSIQALVNAAYKEEGQLDMLVRFLKINPGIIRAMKAKDWAGVARGYNGPAYAQNQYDTKLAAAYKKFGGV